MATNFSVSTSIKGGWEATKANLIVLLGIMLGYLLLSSILSWIPMGMPPLSMASIGTTLVSFVLSCLFTLGYCKMTLQAVDGDEPTFGAFAEAFSCFPKFFLAYLLYALITLAALSLFVLPGIYVGVRLQYMPFFILEGSGVIDSLSKSWELTKGEMGKLLLLLLAYIGIILLGVLALFVGVFVAVVVVYVVGAYSYRLLQRDYQERMAVYTESMDIGTEG